MKSSNSSSRSASSKRSLYSSRESLKNPFNFSCRKRVCPSVFLTLQLLVMMRLRSAPVRSQMIMVWSQVMYSTAGLQLSISHPCAREMPVQQRQEMFRINFPISSLAEIGRISSAFPSSRNFTITCQLFLHSPSRMAFSCSIRSELSSMALKQRRRYSSMRSQAIERKPHISQSILDYFPWNSLRQLRKAVNCSLTFLDTAFSFLMMLCTNFAIILLRQMMQSYSPFRLRSIFLISPMKKAESLMLSPLLSLMILPRVLEDSFSCSSNLSNSLSRSFSSFFTSPRYRCYSLPNSPWMPQSSLQICFTLFLRSLLLRDMASRMRSMLLLQLGSSCFTFANPLGSLGSAFSSVLAVNLGSSVMTDFSVFQKSRACAYLSSATICAMSFNLPMVISGAARSFLMRDCWMGMYFLKNYSFFTYHSTNCSMVCFVFSICAVFMSVEVFADIMIQLCYNADGQLNQVWGGEQLRLKAITLMILDKTIKILSFFD